MVKSLSRNAEKTRYAQNCMAYKLIFKLLTKKEALSNNLYHLC